MKNKILVNLIPIKQGGGQQVASNFVLQLRDRVDLDFYFLVSKNTYIHQKVKELELRNVIVVDNNYLKRIFFQLFIIPNIVKKENIQIIYTMFGPGISVKNTISVTGSAYSNIFFPEVDFWNGSSFFNKLKLKLVDYYRLKSTLNSDAIIFENESMQFRANKLFNFPLNKTKLILPSISKYNLSGNSPQHQLKNINENHFNVLLLSGWQKNKNIEIIPYVLKELKKQNHNDVSFVISVDINHSDSIKLLTTAKRLNVSKNLILIGPVEPQNLPLIYNKIDAVGLFSLLESFSNNIIEAWYFGKPLFISDLEWARSICKNAAIYVERSSATDISSNITNYRNNKELQKKIKTNSKDILTQYPSPYEKVELQLQYLKELINEKNN
jgi:hypothetical protein